ncbi:MAG: FAD-dependent oxidoreductase [Comamonadaceae bacterium]|nr:MAG: FAD-dependent oxidoreductase [Comamonadaceae bacterium]
MHDIKQTPRPDLDALDQTHVDVVVIGAGINGAAAAEAAAAAGLKVALFDKGDYASGASRQSTRLLHCGLRYLMPGGPITIFLRHPGRFLDVLKTIRRSMAVRSELVRTEPDKLKPIRMHYPLFKGGPYAPWMVDVAFGILGSLSDGKVPLNYRRSGGAQARAENPFVPFLRDPANLSSIASYTEYQFDWPERVVVERVMQAAQDGAVVRNYTPVTGLTHTPQGWAVDVTDAHTGAEARVWARAVLNLTGVWVDRVHALVNRPITRKVTGTKGAHLVFRLPESCKGHGFAAMSTAGRPFYCMPWRDLHFFGPTETLYEGDPDDVYADDADIEFLMRETTHLFPQLALTRADIVSTWAGVRPLTHDATMPMGHRSRRIYDLGVEGLPGAFALTNGSLGAHRQTAQDLLVKLKDWFANPASGKTVAPVSDESADRASAARETGRSSVPPSAKTEMSAAATRDPSHCLEQDTSHAASAWPGAATDAAALEHAVTLEDMMARRLGHVWDADLGLGAAAAVARDMGARLGWDDARITAEIAQYTRTVHHLYGVRAVTGVR